MNKKTISNLINQYDEKIWDEIQKFYRYKDNFEKLIYFFNVKIKKF